jgi:hypothetical protein
MFTWNWFISNRQKRKFGSALGIVLIIIMLATWFVNFTIQEVDNQFKSVYQDRLVPAAYMTEILERYYQNQLLLEQHLQSGSEAKQDSLANLWQINIIANSTLIRQFETTYLTKQEAIYLKNFKQAVKDLQLIQEQILAYSRNNDKQAAFLLYKEQNQGQFQRLLSPLHDLITLQEQVGHELYLSADRKVKSMKLTSYMVIAMSVIIALIAGALLQANRSINIRKPQKYHLN